MRILMDANAVPVPASTGNKDFSENPLNKTIFILIDSESGTKASGVFRFNIQIFDDDDEEEEEEEGPSSESRKNHLVLNPISTFYDQAEGFNICFVANCQFQDSPDQVYFFPSDFSIHDRKSALPCLFNLKTNEVIKKLPCSLRKSWEPIAVAVRKRIYLLSTGYDSSFEAYDPVRNKWYRLSPPPINPTREISGYAVLKDKFILVCVTTDSDVNTETEFYSFNAQSKKWKPVRHQRRHVTDTIPLLFGQGLVLSEDDAYANSPGGVIYCYNCMTQELLVFSYMDETTEFMGSHDDNDLSLGPVSLVTGFKLVRKILDDSDDEGWRCEGDSCNDVSGTIAKVHNNIMCVLHSDPAYPWDTMVVSGMIIRIHDHDFASCSILEAFTCELPLGDLLLEPNIKACIVVQPEEGEDN